jgi:hypothetical protein
MIILQASEFAWLESDDQAGGDQCAHGRVTFSVDGVLFVGPEEGNWTLGAAGLSLLRTLEYDHTADNPVAASDQLFPCCANMVLPSDGPFGSFAIGCPNGVDVYIRHLDGLVHFTHGHKSARASIAEWRDAVFAFAGQVDAFYRQSAPRLPLQDEQEKIGWRRFWGEWNERMDACAEIMQRR